MKYSEVSESTWYMKLWVKLLLDPPELVTEVPVGDSVESRSSTTIGNTPPLDIGIKK
jgi:hypothetical protein